MERTHTCSRKYVDRFFLLQTAMYKSLSNLNVGNFFKFAVGFPEKYAMSKNMQKNQFDFKNSISDPAQCIY